MDIFKRYKQLRRSLPSFSIFLIRSNITSIDTIMTAAVKMPVISKLMPGYAFN